MRRARCRQGGTRRQLLADDAGASRQRDAAGVGAGRAAAAHGGRAIFSFLYFGQP